MRMGLADAGMWETHHTPFSSLVYLIRAIRALLVQLALPGKQHRMQRLEDSDAQDRRTDIRKGLVPARALQQGIVGLLHYISLVFTRLQTPGLSSQEQKCSHTTTQR